MEFFWAASLLALTVAIGIVDLFYFSGDLFWNHLPPELHEFLLNVQVEIVGTAVVGLPVLFFVIVNRRRLYRRLFPTTITAELHDVVPDPTGQSSGVLDVVTMRIGPLGSFVHEEQLVARLVAAERDVTEDRPVVALPDTPEMHMLLNEVLGELSERFAAGGALARSLGLPVVTGEYVFWFTYTKLGGLQITKLRVFMIRADLLEAFRSAVYCQRLCLLKPEYADRIPILKRVAARYANERDGRTESRKVLGTFTAILQKG